MWKKRKTPYILFAVVFILCILLGYYVSGIFMEGGLTIMNFEDRLNTVFSHPLGNYWNEKSLSCIAVGSLVWLYFVSQYLYRNRNFQFGQEHGTSEWADPEKVRKELADKDISKNRILSKNVEVSRTALANNNSIVIGSTGKGKSIGVVVPNILRASASYVLLDVKGELVEGYGNFLKEEGYQIRVLNLKEMEKSNQYNPFRYIKKEEDIIRLVTNIQVNTTPPDAIKGDPFWEDGVAMYLMSLFYYVWLECSGRAKTMNKVLELCNKEMETVDEETTALQILMESLVHGKRGKSHPAYKNYKKLKEGHPETVKSIILMVNAKLKFFETPGIRRIFEDDELHLEELGTGKNRDGKTKTALFLVVPDNDVSFNFLIGMVYTQMFDTLIREADLHYHGPLPVPVEAWMDEFANGARPDRFENLITTLRSRNMSAIIFLQSVDQIKTIYKGDTWGILMDACSTFVFLGAGRGSLATQEYISKLLGQATIDKRSEGEQRGRNRNSNISFDRASRDLMTPSEVGRLPKNKCILLLEGHQPIMDVKNWPFKHKDFKYAKSLGRYENPVFVKRNKDGSYETEKAAGSMVELSEESVAYYKKQAEEEGNVLFFSFDEDTFLDIDFNNEDELDLKEAAKIIKRQNEKKGESVEEITQEVQERPKKETGTVLEWMKDYDLTIEQMEEVVSGLEEGLTEEQVKEYFFMEPERQRQMRRLYRLQNQRKGSIHG